MRFSSLANLESLGLSGLMTTVREQLQVKHDWFSVANKANSLHPANNLACPRVSAKGSGMTGRSRCLQLFSVTFIIGTLAIQLTGWVVASSIFWWQ